jgi:hypothetical protein
MKKLALVSVCILGLAFAGLAVNQTQAKKEPVKTEAAKPAAKPTKKSTAKPAAKPEVAKPAAKPTVK